MIFRDEIVAITFADGFAEFLQAGHIGVRNAASAIRSDAQHELRAAAYRLIVIVEQFREAFQAGFVVRVPKPVELAQRRVCFDGAPTQIASAVDDVPILVRHATVFAP